jgi:hypothetical protein
MLALHRQAEDGPQDLTHSQGKMTKDPKEKRKKRLMKIAFTAFLLSLSAAGWFLLALLADLMNTKLLSISFLSLLPPIALSLILYAFCKYVEKKADAIITERQEQEQQRRRDLVAALSLTLGVRSANTKNVPTIDCLPNSARQRD